MPTTTTTYECLGQIVPGAGNAFATLFLAGTADEVIPAGLQVCNMGAATTFRIRQRVADAAAQPKQYLYYDAPIGANDAFPVMAGQPIGPGDRIEVASASGNVAFTLSGAHRLTV